MISKGTPNTNLSLGVSTFFAGISELVKANIVARYKTKGMLFINPKFIFNGDRVLFMNAIKKKAPSQNLEDEQLELDI